MPQFEDNESTSDAGPRSSFEVYRAEGDALYNRGEFQKSLQSYNQALELQQGDRNTLVARSKVFLQLGEPQKALDDAESSLKDEENFPKGLYQKAEALYNLGKFEQALIHYYRGHHLRAELHEFQVGIQKSQEAIENSIGSPEICKLEASGDLSFFYKEDQEVDEEPLRPRGTTTFVKDPSKKLARKKLKSQKTEKKPEMKRQKTGGGMLARKKELLQKKEKPIPKRIAGDRTAKHLLGEMFVDREYLEKLLHDNTIVGRPTASSQKIRDLCIDGINYLDTRTDFWRQQKPMYARQAEKEMREKKFTKERSSDAISKHVLNTLDDIDKAYAEGRYEDSLKQSSKLMREMQEVNDDDLTIKYEVIANLHSCMGNAQLEMGNYEKAKHNHQMDLELGKEHDIAEAKSRAMDNLGRVYARNGQFNEAIEIWEKKLPLCISSLEKTWLHHELGRCYLELGGFATALEYGENSSQFAEDANDPIWKLNATVLVAQSQVKLGNFEEAKISFSKSMEMAQQQDDIQAQKVIQKALDDVQVKLEQQGGSEIDESENTDRLQDGDADDEAEEDGPKKKHHASKKEGSHRSSSSSSSSSKSSKSSKSRDSKKK